MENTKISWATHTFSPWIGCSKVHVGCDHCYAEGLSGRLGVKWGPAGTRRRTVESTWRKVEAWNRAAGTLEHFGGHDRPRVFASLCDPFEDRPELLPWRRDFFALIDRCPNLDFLLLTKRPQNVRRMWDSLWGINEFTPPGSRTAPDRCNVFLVYSASDQESLEAGMPHLMACGDLVRVLGLSLEPLVGEIDLCDAHIKACPHAWIGKHECDAVDWVIVGGESGPRARQMELSWLESIAEQCLGAGVACFVKQDSGRKPGQQGRICDRLWNLKQFPQL